MEGMNSPPREVKAHIYFRHPSHPEWLGFDFYWLDEESTKSLSLRIQRWCVSPLTTDSYYREASCRPIERLAKLPSTNWFRVHTPLKPLVIGELTELALKLAKPGEEIRGIELADPDDLTVGYRLVFAEGRLNCTRIQVVRYSCRYEDKCAWVVSLQDVTECVDH